MDRSVALARSRVRTLSRRLRLLDMRRSARWVLDQFRFGTGSAERLAAATVLAVLLVLAVLGAAAALRLPAPFVLAVGGVVLLTAVVTSGVLVLTPPDGELAGRREELVKQLATATDDLDDAEEAAAEEEDRRERRAERRRVPCKYCGADVRPEAKKCPHCREILDNDLARERELARRPKANSGVAAVLSFFVPGVGQLYKGETLSGLMWFVAVQGTYVAGLLTLMCLIGFAIVPVAILLHLLCVFDAATGG